MGRQLYLNNSALLIEIKIEIKNRDKRLEAEKNKNEIFKSKRKKEGKTSQSILEVKISMSAGTLATFPIFTPIRFLIELLEAISTSL